MFNHASHLACSAMSPDHCRPFSLPLGRTRTPHINPDQKLDFDLGQCLNYPGQALAPTKHTGKKKENHSMDLKLNPNEYERAKKCFGNGVAVLSSSDRRFPPELLAILDGLHFKLNSDYICATCGGFDNLCAVVLPTPSPATVDAKDVFLAANASLKGSAIGSWSNFSIVFLRVPGWRPANRIRQSCAWFSTGMIPIRPMGFTSLYEGIVFFDARPVATIEFKDLVWPPDIQDSFLLETLEFKHGKLFLDGPANRNVFGSYTAAKYLKIKYRLEYSHDDDRFTMVEDGYRRPITNSKLIYMIYAFLSDQAQKVGVLFTGDKPEDEIINDLKHICLPSETGTNGDQPEKILATP